MIIDPDDSAAGAAAEDAPRVNKFTYHEFLNDPTPRRLRQLPSLIRTAFVIVWRSAPRQLAASIACQLISAGAIAVQLVVMRDLLSHLLGGGSSDFSSLLPDMIVLAIVSATMSVSNVLLDAQQRVLGQLVAMYTTDQVVRTATSVDLVTYESPTFHDRLQRAQLSAGSRPTQLAYGLLGMAGGLFAVAGIAVALLLVQPLFCLLIFVAFVPAWLATNRAGRLAYRFSVEQTELERRRWYLFGVLTRKQEAQEVRAFELNGFLGHRHHELFEAFIENLRTLLRKRMTVALIGQLATAILTALAVGVLVWFVTSGRMSLSAAGTAAGAMILLSGRLRGFAGSASSLYEGSLYLDDYASFVEVASKVEADRATGVVPLELNELRADHVSFVYPSRSEPSLVDASLVVRPGEVVALVGENGSGKTTFAKLLAGLYTPASGSIMWDGADISSFDPSSFRERVAVIFQDFIRYHLSARENIAMGDHRRFDDMDAIVTAARAAGLHETLTSLEHGYETLLGPEFYGGSDISGGQWQRVALARAFFRQAPIVILDEPTAALDPRAEAALYESMRELFAGRGVVLISHRFGSVRGADRIYVLHEGRVVESGNHEDLMARHGYYAELFTLQASRYLD